MFGFLEFEDDQEIVDALLAAAEAWCRSRGCDRMVGPMCFQINDEAGVLIEGFDREPLIREPWNPPYYQARCEAGPGLIKAMDLFGWDLSINDRERMNPILPKVAERAHTKHGITIRHMSRRHLRRDMDEFAKVYNAAWSHNWGFVPYSKADLDAYTIDMQLVFSRDWFMIAEQEGKTVAMAITDPRHPPGLQEDAGPAAAAGLVVLPHARDGSSTGCRVGFLGVLPEYQHTGVAAALYLAHFDVAEHARQKHGEASFILEVNSSMNRGLEAMGGRMVKRWRVYERLLEPGAEPSAAAADRAD